MWPNRGTGLVGTRLNASVWLPVSGTVGMLLLTWHVAVKRSLRMPSASAGGGLARLLTFAGCEELSHRLTNDSGFQHCSPASVTRYPLVLRSRTLHSQVHPE